MRINFEIKPVRLSNVVRGIENGVLKAGRKVGELAHDVRVEVKAQQLMYMSRKASKLAEDREIMRRFDQMMSDQMASEELDARERAAAESARGTVIDGEARVVR